VAFVWRGFGSISAESLRKKKVAWSAFEEENQRPVYTP